MNEVKLASFFAGYIDWIGESCMKEKIKKIYFFTREGVFLKKIYEMRKQEEWPKAELLEVSRLSTFAPSLREITSKEFMRMWRQYETQSMRMFFASLGMEGSVLRPYMDQYSLPNDEMIRRPWQDKRMISFLKNVEVQRILQQFVEYRRVELFHYLELQNFSPKCSEKIAVVDIGWRGSIQDNLCYMMPNKIMYGFYLSLAPFVNPQPDNAYKVAYLSSEESKVILKYPTPVEMLCNSEGGSIVGYEDGKAIALCDDEEEQVYEMFTERVQRKILECIAQKKYKVGGSRAAVTKLLLHPDKRMAHFFFLLKHNETFGTGKFSDKKIKIPEKLFWTVLIRRSAFAELKRKLWDTSWPQGYLCENGMALLILPYNWLLFRGKHFEINTNNMGD